MDLTIEDFQRVLFELYLAQRENNALRAELARLRGEPAGGAPGAVMSGHSHDHNGNSHDAPDVHNLIRSGESGG